MHPGRVDAHQHFWRLARGDYDWLDTANPAFAPLARDFEPDDLAPLRRAHGIGRTVLVQAAATLEETEHLLSLADGHPEIAGVVGWIDLSHPGRLPVLERWASHPAFKGVRPMLQDLSDPEWILHGPHPAMLQALVDHGLRLDALVKPPHLAALTRFVEAWPMLKVVVDHAAKPVLREGWQAAWVAPWRAGISALASHPQVCCKFSGLLTEADAAQLTSPEAAEALIAPVWEELLQRFGPERLMWGSDWPVLNLAADYGRWADIAGRFIDRLALSDRQAVWGGTAERFYNLGRAA
jgi:L-fuconolactonase